MHLADWIGKTESMADTVTATPVAALAATLDRPPQRPAAGTPLPPLWHWLYFLPLARQSGIGPDGHPQRGGFLPPVPLPRRMWAGSQIALHVPLAVGDAIERRSTIDNVTSKHGRSGELVFVRVKHEICVLGTVAPAITEFHDIVYREAAKPGAAGPPPQAAPTASPWELPRQADDVLLFRYSALTFNSHRIHYDRKYVTEVEGYPGLVVHGPLLATLLLDLLRHRLPQATVVHFEFRALRPVFDIHRFFVCGAPDPDGHAVKLWIRDHEGALAMDATAGLR